jgi:hypothetical protein
VEWDQEQLNEAEEKIKNNQSILVSSEKAGNRDENFEINYIHRYTSPCIKYNFIQPRKKIFIVQ